MLSLLGLVPEGFVSVGSSAEVFEKFEGVLEAMEGPICIGVLYRFDMTNFRKGQVMVPSRRLAHKIVQTSRLANLTVNSDNISTLGKLLSATESAGRNSGRGGTWRKAKGKTILLAAL